MMRRATSEALIAIGIPASNSGFQYIVDAICLLQEPEYFDGKITNLYEHIGKMHNTTLESVERCIRHSFHKALIKCDREVLEFYLGWKKGQNASNKNLLYLLYLNLKNKEDGENEDNQNRD